MFRHNCATLRSIILSTHAIKRSTPYMYATVQFTQAQKKILLSSMLFEISVPCVLTQKTDKMQNFHSQPPIQRNQRFFPGVMRPGREVHHSTAISTDVKNVGIQNFIHIYVMCDVCRPLRKSFTNLPFLPLLVLIKRSETSQQASFMRQGITQLNNKLHLSQSKTTATITLSGPTHFSQLPTRRRDVACFSGRCYKASSISRYYRHLSVNSTTKYAVGRMLLYLLMRPITPPCKTPLKNMSTSPQFANIHKTTDKIIFTINSRRLKTNNFVLDCDLRSSAMLSTLIGSY